MIPLMIAMATAVGVAEGAKTPSGPGESSAQHSISLNAQKSVVAKEYTLSSSQKLELTQPFPQKAAPVAPRPDPSPSLSIEKRADTPDQEPILGLVGESSRPASASKWELTVEDQRLDVALNRWAEKAGYSLRWDAERYVLIGAKTTFFGSFKQALNEVLESPGVKYSEYPLEACIYANNPPLVRITKLGDQTQECR